jgi:hypothetical protein
MILSKEELATLLENAAAAVRSGDSTEGRVYYVASEINKDHFEVTYGMRVGKNDGRVSVIGN